MSEDNKVVVRRLFEDCFNCHNANVYPEFYADVVFRASLIGELRNHAHLQFLLTLFSAFPDAHWTLNEQIAEGDKVVSRWTFAGTHIGTFLGIAPTGRYLINTGVSVQRLVDRKIVEEWAEWDTLGMMQQLGEIAAEESIADMVAP